MVGHFADHDLSYTQIAFNIHWYLLGSLPEPVKTQENLKKFVKIVIDDVRIRGQLLKLVSADCECKRAEEAVVSSS